MASRQDSSAKDAAAPPEQQRDVEPVYEWLDAGAVYHLRLTLPGFKKEDVQVYVDPAGRLTVRGHHGSLRLHKVFQLPSTCNLDGITGRLDGSVLILTVPKLPASEAAALLPSAKKEEKEDTKITDEDVAGKLTDHKGRVASEAERTIEAARERVAGRHGEVKAEEPSHKAAPPRGEAAAPGRQHQDDEKARAEHKARLAREAERRIEAARASLAPAPEKKAPCWKERAAAEGLKLAEAIGKNKEVIATAVAAFTLGVFVTHKLCARSN
ncbi:hypothetical protein GUJ93_ZPchr0008g11840 [Zizania palustris]|uniref:SHSP domain-containing protein n=1 Tax=Zizania palustris TaxID=103762 RepID=A0A8J5RGX9_ZIZPA|nr:hypothetical protein GUJ93_ZPchr0008g11840 [Zizania palustris]